ncbi:MAG: hypothetical protein R3B51_11705 [Thermodesulfobacteriota bacterium]
MSKAKWLFMFLLALSMAAPTFAVELTLGGFPSYMRTRARYIGNATFISALSNGNAQALGFTNNKDEIFFVDTSLRLTPQLVLNDAVTIGPSSTSLTTTSGAVQLRSYSVDVTL